ncbi:MAG: hypothetical protein V1779_13270 [bacterium]
MNRIYFGLTLLFVLVSCGSSYRPIEINKLYRFYTTSSPIVNTSDLGSKEYKFLESAIDTMKKDTKLKINIVSFREEGYYDLINNENCSVTKIARDYLMQKGIEQNRITHAFGKADLDKNISHQGLAVGKSTSNCWLEIQLYY